MLCRDICLLEFNIRHRHLPRIIRLLRRGQRVGRSATHPPSMDGLKVLGKNDPETRMIADLSHSRACRSSPSHAHWRLKIAFPFVFLVLCPSQIVERQTTYSSSPRQAKGTSSVHLARGLLQPSKWPIGGDGVALRVPLKRTPTATTTTTTTAADKSTVTDIGHAPPTPPYRPPCSGSRLRSRCHALWRSPAVIDPPERVPLKRTAYCYHHHRHHSR